MISREKKIESILSRGIEEVVVRNHLRDALLESKKLTIKLGIDPTAPDLHLGHAVLLKKLRDFQDLGCKIALVIGDFTARIGDPSGRENSRPPLSLSEVNRNMKRYLDQAGKVFDISRAKIFYNSQWFEKESSRKFVELASMGSIQQILRRADFRKRIEAGKDVSLLEALYALFQGYDSVELEADVEIGGSDQIFNLLMGRKVQRHFGLPQQDVITTSLLEGTDGKKKMSKSYGNYIGLGEGPDDMYGKIMSIPDSLVNKYFLLVTDLTEEKIKTLSKELSPKEFKSYLGVEVVKTYHGDKKAEKARKKFDQIFSKKEVPSNIPGLKLSAKKMSVVDLVISSGIIKSKSEARRVIVQGGVGVNDVVKNDPNETVSFRGGEILKIGKKNFFKVKT